MTQIELTEQLLNQALRVDDHPSPPGLHESVRMAVAAVSQPRRLVSLPWPNVARRLPRAVHTPLWLAILTALMLSAMIGAVLIGSRINQPSPLNRVENGPVAFVTRVGPDGLPAATGTEVAVFAAQPDGSGLRRLTRGALGGMLTATDLTWSPDGSRIAFSPDFSYGEQSSIQVLDVASGTITTVAEVIPAKDPPFVMAWSPDGARLAIGDWPGVQIASVDGVSARMVRPQAGFPTWSPDGSKLAVADFIAPEGEWMTGNAEISATKLVVLDIASGDSRELFRRDGYAWLEPRWSPDGAWISFQSEFLSNPQTIEIIRPDGSGRREVGTGWGAVWSPDAAVLAFGAEDQMSIWAFSLDGTRSKVADGNPYVGLVRWAPDSESLVVTTADEDYGQFTIALIAWHDGSGLQPFQPWPAGVNPIGWAWLPRNEQQVDVEASRTENGQIAFAGIVGPDGMPTAWDHQTFVGWEREIFLAQPDGSQTRRLTTSSGFKSRPTWSPDGSEIAFIVEVDPEFRAVGELGVVDVETGVERRLGLFDGGAVRREYALRIAWSPGGERLAYSDAMGVHLIDSDGFEPALVAADACCPAWSHDGVRLLYSAGFPSGASGLWMYNTETGDRSQITSGSANDAAWTSDGRIVFDSDDGVCGRGLSIVSSDGSSERLLQSDAIHAVLSPDSTQVAFIGTGADQATCSSWSFRLWAATLGGEPVEIVTSDITGAVWPRWSPDGQWITFDTWTGRTADGDSARETWIIRPNGSDRQRIETGPYDESDFDVVWDWQPVSVP